MGANDGTPPATRLPGTMTTRPSMPYPFCSVYVVGVVWCLGRGCVDFWSLGELFGKAVGFGARGI